MRKIIAVSILALALGLTACASSREHTADTPVEDETGYSISRNDLSTFAVTLPSGRKVECVVLTFRGSALQCWPVNE